MPTGQGVDPAEVLILNAEDGIDDTIRPRLDAAGADCDRVHLWDMQSVLPHFPDSTDWLSDQIAEHGIKLVILDTLTTFLGARTDSHRDQDVRRALVPVVQVASKSGAAVLAVRHLNKGQQSSAMYRGMGSMAFIGLARAGWHAGPHPDEDVMVLAPVKNNLARDTHAMRYRISERNGSPVVSWDGSCDLIADDLVSADTCRMDATDAAARWLEGHLADGAVPANEVKKAAASAGHAEKTLERAKKVAGVASRKVGDLWRWELSGSRQGGQDGLPAGMTALTTLE